MRALGGRWRKRARKAESRVGRDEAVVLRGYALDPLIRHVGLQVKRLQRLSVLDVSAPMCFLIGDHAFINNSFVSCQLPKGTFNALAVE